MATLNLTIPDAQVPRILTAFKKQSGNPDYNAADLKQFLIAQVRAVVKSQEDADAAEAAKAAITVVDIT